jgi:hypothetical protein
LKGLSRGDLRVANIYGLNNAMEWCFNWVKMVQLLPNYYKWIFVQDWNMVKQHRDKSSTCGHLIFQSKSLIWEQLKAQINVEDVFDSKGKLKYTWDN